MEQVITGSDLLLVLHGGIDVTGGTAVMKYRKPGETLDGELAVEILDAAQASCRAAITATVHDVPGIWRTWLKTTDAEGKIGYGRAFRFRSLRPGS